MAKRTKAELDAELRLLKSTRKADGWVLVLQSLIRWTAIVAVSGFIFLSIRALAGQITLADIGINFLGKIEVSVALAWSVGAIGGIYGWRQRKLRRDTIERLQKRIKSLEINFDKQRSTSRLTTRGDTRPEDKV